jgi:hypothetical protein
VDHRRVPSGELAGPAKGHAEQKDEYLNSLGSGWAMSWTLTTPGGCVVWDASLGYDISLDGRHWIASGLSATRSQSALCEQLRTDDSTAVNQAIMDRALSKSVSASPNFPQFISARRHVSGGTQRNARMSHR